jgi:hypothetical protein
MDSNEIVSIYLIYSKLVYRNGHHNTQQLRQALFNIRHKSNLLVVCQTKCLTNSAMFEEFEGVVLTEGDT